MIEATKGTEMDTEQIRERAGRGGLPDVWRDEVYRLLDEIERLQAIVGRLPKTADGVPIVPGDVLHFLDVSMQTVLCWNMPEHPRGDEMAVANCCPFSDAYSTREAAEKARQA